MYGRGAGTWRRSGGMGFGFRGSSPPYPYIGRGRGGLPRCQYPGLYSPLRNTAYPDSNYPVASGQEIDILKQQAEDMKQALARIEARINDLETKTKE